MGNSQKAPSTQWIALSKWRTREEWGAIAELHSRQETSVKSFPVYKEKAKGKTPADQRGISASDA